MLLLFQEGVKYKSVNTYSGWTSATRHKYQTVKVKMLKSGGKEVLIERLASPPQLEDQTEKKDKEVNKCTNKEKKLDVKTVKKSSVSDHCRHLI